jgi:hypothetical protein
MSSRYATLDAGQGLIADRPNPTLALNRPRPKVSGAGRVPRRVALFPIVFFEAYLTLTVLLFAFGPWPWEVSNPVTLYGFLILAQAALLAGYLTAARKHPRPSIITWKPSRWVVVSLLFNFAWLPYTYELRTNTFVLGFNFGGMVNAMLRGFSNPAANYAEKTRNLSTLGPSTPMTYAALLVYPLLWILVPVGVMYWSRLALRTRIGIVFFIICDILVWMASGMNKGIADYALLLPWLLIARRPSVIANFNSRKLLTITVVVLVGMGALFMFFSMNIVGRSGGQAASQVDLPAGISLDTDHPMLKLLPPAQQGPVAGLVSYVTQGYYALSLALHEPFMFCYGVGNSYFLEGLTRKFVSSPIIDRTYPARIETYGWNRYGRWHSLYVWFASDVSFYGTIAVMFLLGRLFAIVWLDVVVNKDPLAICLFTLLILMLYYTPANNQILGFPGTAIPFWAFLPAWWISRRPARQSTAEYRRASRD